MKNAFWRPLTMRLNVFWVSKNQNSMEKIGQTFHICLRSGPRWLTPPPYPTYCQPDRKISVFFSPPFANAVNLKVNSQLTLEPKLQNSDTSQHWQFLRKFPPQPSHIVSLLLWKRSCKKFSSKGT